MQARCSRGSSWALLLPMQCLGHLRPHTQPVIWNKLWTPWALQLDSGPSPAHQGVHACLVCSVTKSCLTLYDPMDFSTAGFPIPHRLPELAQVHVCWISDAVQPSHPLPPSPPFVFNLSSTRVPALACVHAQLLTHVWVFATSCTVACQTPLSVGFSRQEYWTVLPFPSPGDLPNPGMGNSSRVFGTLTPPPVSQR